MAEVIDERHGDSSEASVSESSSESEEVSLLCYALRVTSCLSRSLICFDVTVKIHVEGERAVLVRLLVCTVAVIVGAERKRTLAKTRLDINKMAVANFKGCLYS